MAEQLLQGVMVNVPDAKPAKPPRWEEPREKAVDWAQQQFQAAMDRQVRNGCDHNNENR